MMTRKNTKTRVLEILTVREVREVFSPMRTLEQRVSVQKVPDAWRRLR